MASVAKRRWTYQGAKREAWVVRYKDKGGAHRSRQFDLKKEADAYCRKVENELEAGLHIAEINALTVAKVVEQFLVHTEQRLKDGQIGRGYVKAVAIKLNLHVVPNIGATRFRDLTPAMVDNLYRDLRRQSDLAPIYAREVIHTLGLVERFAIRQEYAAKATVPLALKELRGISARKVRPPTVSETEQLLRLVFQRRPGQRERARSLLACFVHLAACCGLRMGEIRALDVEHLDLERGEVRVRRNLAYGGEIKGPKTAAGNRDVPLPPHLVAMLREWMEHHFLPNERKLIFTTYNATALLHSNMWDAWTSLLKAADLYDENDPMHFHGLRHFAGSWWLHSGIPIGDVSEMLGHANPSITMKVYAHALSAPNARRELMRNAGALLMTQNCAQITHEPLSA